MAYAVNQDFVTAVGDDVYPIFTVRDGAGVAIDISTVAEITWYFKATSADAAIMTLTKSAGQITFVTTGIDGRFQVNIGKVITAALAGWYLHGATITDAAGNVTTIEIGRMKVGVTPEWTYDPTKIATVPLFQARRWIGDVINNDRQLLDQEILWAIAQRGGNVLGAAADCLRFIAEQYSRKVDTVSPGELRTAYGSQASKYALRARELEALSLRRGSGVQVFAGGLTVSSKVLVQSDTDRVQPSFNIGMTDARLPVGQLGNETPTMPMGGEGGS